MVKRPATRKPVPKAQPARAPALEWGAAGVGLLLILAVLTLLAMHALSPNGPPILRVTQIDQTTNPAGHTIKIEVVNDGATAAAGVLVEGALGSETSEVSLDYVPAKSKREASLVFQGDPKAGALTLRVKGFVEP